MDFIVPVEYSRSNYITIKQLNVQKENVPVYMF